MPKYNLKYLYWYDKLCFFRSRQGYIIITSLPIMDANARECFLIRGKMKSLSFDFPYKVFELVEINEIKSLGRGSGLYTKLDRVIVDAIYERKN